MDKITILKKLLELYKQLLELLKKKLELLKKKVEIQKPPVSVNKNEAIYREARACIGKEMAPLLKEYGCVEAVDKIVETAIGQGLEEKMSTYRLYEILEKNPRFIKVEQPEPGNIVISPTAYGNGKIPGHVGIVSENSKIMSNNSSTLKWAEHYTISSWESYFKKVGGFPVYYYQVT